MAIGRVWQLGRFDVAQGVEKANLTNHGLFSLYIDRRGPATGPVMEGNTKLSICYVIKHRLGIDEGGDHCGRCYRAREALNLIVMTRQAWT
jgi:hypothetical protein